ncbi:MAG: ABC transporter ATP-binding protein, partial [Campylobacterales bacterium]|nr:ABC transporter ATP-binding protein [Campylobacterales bacterium]
MNTLQNKYPLSLSQLFKTLLSFKKELLLANLIAIVAVIISTPVPLLMPLLVDEVLLGESGILMRTVDGLFGAPQMPYMYVLVVLVITLLMRFVFFILNFFQTKYFTIISKTITFGLRQRVLSHLGNVSLSGYEHFGSSRANALLVVDVETVDEFLGTTISRLLISILTVLGVGVVLLLIHWPLALFILLLNPFVVVLTTKIARSVSKLKKRQNEAFEVFQAALSETLDLFIQVRASNQEKRFIAQVEAKARAIKDESIAFGYKSDAASRFSFLVFLSGFEIFRAASIMVVAYSDLSIGLMLGIFGYLWVMMGPVQEILGVQYAFHNAKVALGRINALLELPKEPEYTHRINPFVKGETNGIVLKDVNFAYELGKPVLEHVSLEIPRGKRVAIVGASGSGKSTLAQIIVGFYPLDSGALLFDGADVREIGLDIVRENVFLILQNPQLFNGTIRTNITLGEEISDTRLYEALAIAQLESFVNEQALGLETPVGKDGIKLSGGQRQRLSIARMIVKNPNVVILDESTSALDVHTEKALFEGLDRYLKGKTTIVIAHRLSTIRMADYIYL